ncbi:unnamed protein product [Cuscuta epithymum]|uniref:BHLH domain-containing protein n=1 Tax=Cuscuta epithymum TaxID=186058 RepID=A0AAV0EXJ5_9ASTE|nr:unnamed protein product [Cuscuta epithymum]
MDMELQQQQNIEMEQCYNESDNPSHFTQDWGFLLHHQTLPATSVPETPYPHLQTTPDLLSMFPLPSSLIPNPHSIPPSNNAYQESSAFFTSLGLFGDDVTSPDSTVVHRHDDPSMFTSLPQGAYGFGCSSGSSSLFGEMDDKYQVLDYGSFHQGMDGSGFVHTGFEFNATMEGLGKKRGSGNSKDAKHFALEKQRRVQFKDKFQALRKLIPNPTKNDRASIVGDAIVYINDLRNRVAKLEAVIEQKRNIREKMQRQITSDGVDGKSEDDMDQPYNVNIGSSSMRSSFWFQKKSKNAEVDVRVMAGEVTVKIVQEKGSNCLLPVSGVLDELHLDLHHIAGGIIGDHYKFLFNYKIFEGTTLYASSIANKLIEAVEKSVHTHFACS